MKSLLIFLGLFVLSLSAFSQQIGSSYDEVKNSLSSDITQKRIGKITVLTNYQNDFDVLYFFEKGICYTIAYRPKSDKAMQNLIQENNKTCKVKNRKWYKKLENSSILEIELKQDPDYGKVFVYNLL